MGFWLVYIKLVFLFVEHDSMSLDLVKVGINLVEMPVGSSGKLIAFFGGKIGIPGSKRKSNSPLKTKQKNNKP